MASMRTINLADAESVFFHSKTRKLVIHQPSGSVEVLRLPEANTIFNPSNRRPTIFVRCNPPLTLEVSEGQFGALMNALVGPLVDNGTQIK